MTEQTRERIRLNILRQLHVVYPFGLPSTDLQVGLRLDLFQITVDEVAFEMTAMAELGLVEMADPTVSPKLVKWKRTPAGMKALVAAGLIS